MRLFFLVLVLNASSCSWNKLDSVIESRSSSLMSGRVGIQSVEIGSVGRVVVVVDVVVVGLDLVVGFTNHGDVTKGLAGLAVRSIGATIGFHMNLDMASQLDPFWPPVSLLSNPSSVSLTDGPAAGSGGTPELFPDMAFTTLCNKRSMTFFFSLDLVRSHWHRYMNWMILNEMMRHLILQLAS